MPFAVNRLQRALESLGKDMWVDVEDISPGAKWRDRVRRAIAACRALVFVLTPESLASAECRGELDEAARLNKLIIPVVHHEVDENALPASVAEPEWIFLREQDDFDAGLAKLVEALETDLEWRDQHTRLAARTREWLDAERNKSFLLRGTELTAAERWLADQGDHRERATDEQASFIAESRQAATRRQRALIAGVLGALAIAVGLAVFAFVQRQEATHQTHIAQSELLARTAVEDRGDPQVSSLLSLAAYRLAPTLDAQNAVLTAASSHQLGAPLAAGDSVLGVAYSPDGKTLASADADGTVRLWDVATHRTVGEPLAMGNVVVAAVAFSPDGKTLASASSDGTLRLWNVRSHQQLGRTFAGHVGPALAVAFSPNGKTLASAGFDKTVRLWSVASHHQLGPPLTGHVCPVFGVAFSPDGKPLASGGTDSTVRLWHVRGRLQLGAPLSGHADWVYGVAFSPDGKTIASGSKDGTARLWRTASNRQIGRPLTGHGGLVLGVAFSPDGKTLAAAEATGTVRLWGVASHRQLGSPLTGHTGLVLAVAFSPDGKMLAAAGGDGTIRLWDVASHRRLSEPLTGHSGEVDGVAFSHDGKMLAAAGGDGTIRLWDVASHRRLSEPLTGHSGEVDGVA